MTEVLQSSPSHFSSPSSSVSSPCGHNDAPLPQNLINTPLISVENDTISQEEIDEPVEQEEGGGGGGGEEEREEEERKEREREGDQLSLLALLVTAFRKSLIGCSVFGGKDLCSMEIGVPTNVRHVAHVTFDRFNGFLGLPVEFEPEVPRRAPSASTNVFGVSTESMQLSYDTRGNCVPTILLMMQRQLYAQGGLQAEGIFRITGENGQEQYVRAQLNRGLVPEGIDVHCLAGLIKAWFRELPRGILDSLSPEQVMQSQSEEECSRLVRLLPPTEAALLDWAINLMADVVQLEHLNKMNARNVAMVFAPNMTQMSDPLTALMHAVQVMNFLKTLIMKTLRIREDRSAPLSRIEPSDRNGHQSSSHLCNEDAEDDMNKEGEEESVYFTEEPTTGSPLHTSETDSATDAGSQSSDAPLENAIPWSTQASAVDASVVSEASLVAHEDEGDGLVSTLEKRQSLSSSSILKKVPRRAKERTVICSVVPVEKNKGAGIIALLNPRTELFEAWR